ncbi:MAG TPA: prolyl oligopeptidase family serine peptidase [Gemmatimonadales bacterium]|jgi:dipeptidyl aminopeptidase/acylaminoacyl peptidase
MRVSRLRPSAFGVFALFAPAVAFAQRPFQLTIDNIMRGPDLTGRAPVALRGGDPFCWSPDSRYVYFRWQQPGSADTNLAPYRVSARGGSPERLTDAVADTVLAGPAVWSPDRKQAIYVIKGDLVLWSAAGSRYLTRTPGQEFAPAWSADGGSVFFQRDGNVFALDLAQAGLRQLTDIRNGNAPAEDKAPTGQRGFLAEQQRRLFDFISKKKDKNYPWAQRAADTTGPRPFYAGENKSVGGMRVSPDGKYVLLTVNERPRTAKPVDLPLWVTDDGYVQTTRIRTKVGDQQGTSRAAVLEVATGKVTFVGDSLGTGERSIGGIDVSKNSRHALIRADAANNKDRWLAVVDLPTMTTREIVHDHDDAWIGFPGPALAGFAGFYPDGETVYFASERTGWIHLYKVAAAGGEATALTSGTWEVQDASLSSDGLTWELSGTKDGFAEVHYYTMPAMGGAITRMTTPVGRQDVAVSPDGKMLAVSASEANHPPELYLAENRPGAELKKVTESTTAEFRSFNWIKPEIVMVTARDGIQVPARLYRPQGTVAARGKRPAVIFVHGAGYAQNVHNWWSSYSHEYMFHHFLASKGYTVLDMDYRGSAAHGRDWRVAIYRHMGGKDLDDNVDGARWLVKNMGVDSAKIGIYGGSYGGFMTLMAMFTQPGVFAAGAALRPVSDWAHYNHGYTSAILNNPQSDTLAYQQSSPIYFAQGLKGNLLICHGMVDDNVNFEDTARLAQRLIELGKDHWQVAMYPVERHGFEQASSWNDEYRRIYNLFDQTLR